MKTNRTMTRLTALILVGGIATATTFAADPTTPAQDKRTAKHHLPVGHVRTMRKSAKTSRATTSTNSEPDRIFDLQSRSFISNPDYHEPTPPTPARQSGAGTEPDRIFNAITRSFEPNPGYHAPAMTTKGTPARIGTPNRIESLTRSPGTSNRIPPSVFGGRRRAYSRTGA
jgi:hypothetical protein